MSTPQDPESGSPEATREPELGPEPGAGPSSARIYDYLLGGSYNNQADREAAEQLIAISGDAAVGAWANRGFVQRAARWLCTDAGLDQLIDVGAGLPTAQNTHQIVGPGCRVVYIDNDPEVVEQGQRLLRDVPDTAYVRRDLRDPDLLFDPDLRALIDLERPVGLMLIGVLYFVPDSDRPHDLVARLVDALPSGSYLALSHLITDRMPPDKLSQADSIYQRSNQPLTMRTIAEVQRFFDGLELIPPYEGAAAKLDYIGLWGAEDPAAADDDTARIFVAGVARKP